LETKTKTKTKIMDGNKIFFDLESGGFEKTKNALCELGAIVVNSNNEIIDKLQFYVRPYKREASDELHSYKPDAMAVNGITEQQIAEGHLIELVLLKFIKLIVDHEVQTVIGHNSDFFDVKWISYLLGRFTPHQQYFDQLRKVDTMKLAQAKIDCRPANYKLGTLCAYYGIEITDAHTAIGDCTATLELYKRLI
jgi:DNA polymerase III epsilon subunit-like protein